MTASATAAAEVKAAAHRDLIDVKLDRVNKSSLLHFFPKFDEDMQGHPHPDNARAGFTANAYITDKLHPVVVFVSLFCCRTRGRITAEFTRSLFRSQALRTALRVESPYIVDSQSCKLTVLEHALRFVSDKTKCGIVTIVTDTELQPYIGWDRIAPHLWPDEIRRNAGLYWRTTGCTYEKLRNALFTACPGGALARHALPFSLTTSSQFLLRAILSRAERDGTIEDRVYIINDTDNKVTDSVVTDVPLDVDANGMSHSVNGHAKRAKIEREPGDTSLMYHHKYRAVDDWLDVFNKANTAWQQYRRNIADVLVDPSAKSLFGGIRDLQMLVVSYLPSSTIPVALAAPAPGSKRKRSD